MAAPFDAFFATARPGPLGQRLCIWHAPHDGSAPKSLIVFIHGFAEEMNKSRRMAALQSRAFAAAGHAVLQMDLLGCGDSAGDFGDATWQDWIDDVVDAVRIARERHTQSWPDAAKPLLWLWGHRMGCLLATAAAPRIEGGCNFLFWQPTPNGKAVLQQFLRLETAAALMGKAPASGRPSAKDALAAGSAVEVAGYTLSPGSAHGLEAARLAPPASGANGRMEWLDIAPQTQDAASPVAQQALTTWRAAGWATRHRSLVGPMFWQTTEIEDAPDLVPATLSALATVRKPIGAAMPIDMAEAA